MGTDRVGLSTGGTPLRWERVAGTSLPTLLRRSGTQEKTPETQTSVLHFAPAVRRRRIRARIADDFYSSLQDPAMADGFRVLDHRRAVAAAWAVACVATAGSLAYSLGLGLFPCRLCWYQRILMYPLVVILGMGLTVPRTDLPVWRFVFPLSVPGIGLAAYHSWLQVAPSSTCSFAGCGTVQFRLLGLTIPNQSLLAFAAITAILGWSWLRDRRRSRGGETT